MRAAVAAFDVIRRRITGQSSRQVSEAIAHSAVELRLLADWASITELRAGKLVTTAATDDRARQGDYIQYELGNGPCVDAVLEDPVVLIDNLPGDARWPEFGRRMHREFRVCSMLSFRLMLDEDDVIGGLNLYSQQPAAFDDQDVERGHLLAAHGATAIAAAQARTQAHHLQVAIQTNRDIGVAIGILMRGFMLTRNDAFDLLRLASQHQHRKLRDIALEVIDTGTLTVPETTLNKQG
jgi:hypothetical protein